MRKAQTRRLRESASSNLQLISTYEDSGEREISEITKTDALRDTKAVLMR